MTEGQIIKAAREAKGYTQAEVSKKLGFTTPQFVSNWERNIAKAPPSAFKKLGKMLGLLTTKKIVEIRVNEYRTELLGTLKN